MELLASSTQMPSSGAVTVDLTAVVLSATRQAVTGRTVTFSTIPDTTAFTDAPSASGVSDANGVVTTKLHLGTDKSKRTITVTATADSAVGKSLVDVTGTTVTISGNTSLAITGAPSPLTFSVKDSAGTPLSGIAISVGSKQGNTITPPTGTTDPSGQFTATVTVVNPGNDVITVTAAEVSVTQALTISSASFALNISNPNPACVGMLKSPPEIPLSPDPCSTPTLTVNWTDATTSPIGKTVIFSRTRGTVTPSSSTLVAPGNASVTVSSTSAGPAIISASGQGGTPAGVLNVVFVATSAASATVQAVPGTIQVTTGSASQASNSSTISVQVRDKNNNLVKNAGVSFANTSDPTGGSLSAPRAVTDVNGSASVAYTAGTTSSPSNGVAIQATVTDVNGDASISALPVPVTNTVLLTVAGQALLVRLGTDAVVAVDPTTNANIKNYLAIVTDAAGNAVVGTTVRFALRPARYFKGYYFFVGGSVNRWVQFIMPPFGTGNLGCPNEDTNFNGILDVPPTVPVSEDNNGNGTLDPGNVASVTPTGVTDSHGVAIASITYPKDHAFWVEQILEARTGVVGNDPPALVTLVLPGLTGDYGASNTAPPGEISPYGIGDVSANIFTSPAIFPNPAVVTCSNTF